MGHLRMPSEVGLQVSGVICVLYLSQALQAWSISSYLTWWAQLELLCELPSKCVPTTGRRTLRTVDSSLPLNEPGSS